MKPPDFLGRLEARIALALAKAQAALAGVVSAQSRISQTNGAPLGTAATLTWTSSSFTSLSGRVTVFGSLLIVIGAGGTLAPGDICTGNLLRDGAAIIPGPMSSAVAEAASPGTTCTVFGEWGDTVTPATSHTWAIQAQIGGGHTAAVAIAQAVIMVQGLP